MSEKLIVSRSPEQVVTLTFNRPSVRNALDWETQTTFLATVRTLAADSSVRAVVLTGAGAQAFCAGGDLVELAAYAKETDGAQLAAIMGEALNLLENAPFPSIAAINGHALGGGSEIALTCDLRIMDERAKLGFVQLSMALTPGWGAGQRLLRLVGYSRALELLLAAQPFTAHEALAKGLVNQVCAAGTSLQTALALARRIAGWDAAAVAAVKRVLRYGLTLPYDQAQAAERAEFPPLWASAAHLEAVEAFLNRKNE